MGFIGGGVVLALQNLESIGILGVDGLHGRFISAVVWVVELRQAAIFLFQFVQGAAVGEVFHIDSS